MDDDRTLPPLGSEPGGYAAPSLSVLRPEPAPGTTIGRFEVLSTLGQGAMGLVLAARDPTLDRNVAIKLLRPDAHGQGDERAKAALVREAQTVARLEHANVVSIYEAGLSAGQVFVAMQFVDGGTLRQWMDAGPHPYEDTVRMFIEAGRGLDAAHRAGLVHRDFKPDNVLVARDGRVFVSDFGLAGWAATGQAELHSPPGLPAHELATDPAELQPTQTRAGAVLGSPAYMAPEVWEGAELDPLSDQFAFCVALWEALYGQRPFVGDSIPILAANIARGQLPPPPAGDPTPAWLREILVRGLAGGRQARWPSMKALLRRLQRGDPAAKWRRVALVVGVTAVVAGGFGGAAVWLTDFGGDGCSSGEARMAEVWNEEVRRELLGAFEATKLGYASDSFTRAAAILDAYGEAWTATYRDTCEATHTRNEQSEDVLDLRMRCLDARLGEFSGLVTQLRSADETMVDKAVPASDGLTPIASCDDVEALAAAIPPPADPATRAQVDALRERIASVAALEQLGHYAQGVEASNSIVEDAREVDYPLVQAEALELQGRLLVRNGDAAGGEPVLREALDLVAETGDARLEARIWDRLLFAVGYMQTRHEEATHLFPAARAAAKRAGDEDLRGRLLITIGTVQSVKAEDRQANATLVEAIEVLSGVHGPDSFIVAIALNTLGSVQHALGELDDAAATYQRAITSFENSVGPQHPNVAAVRHNLGILEQARADFPAARGHMEAALEIWRAAHGEHHPNVATGYENLGALEYVQGNYDAAAALYQKSFDLREQLLEPGDLLLASSHYNIATVDMARGNTTGALEHARVAYDIRVELLGTDHPEVAAVLEFVGILQRSHGLNAEAAETFAQVTQIYANTYGSNHSLVARGLASQGDALLSAERCAEAIPVFEESLTINEAAIGRKHPDLAYALTGLGLCLLEEGKDSAAIEALERAYLLRENNPVDALNRGHTRFAFAKAAWQVGRYDDAHKSASDAIADFESLLTYGDRVVEIQAWVASHQERPEKHTILPWSR